MRRLLLLGVLVAAVAGGALVAALRAGPDASASAQSASFANKGRPVPPAGDAKAALDAYGHGTLYLIATRGDHAYYRVGDSRGRHCNAIGPAAEIGRLHNLSCRSTGAPVIDSLLFEGTRGEPELRVYAAEGFAADDVAEIQLIGERAEVAATARVVENVFRFDTVPSTTITAIAAVDPDGKRVYFRPLRR